MIIEEFFKYRTELLEQSKDEEGFINQSLLLSEVLPSMLDAKLVDSEDCSNSYFYSLADKMKINAYCVNDTGERLQLFLIDEKSIDLSATNESLQISTKAHYETEFKRGVKFLSKSVKGHLNDDIQDSSPARPLISLISSAKGLHQFDVVEIFLISATATVSLQGAMPQPKRIDFENEDISIKYTLNREQKTKDLLIKKRLVDLNFLFNVVISQGKREALTVDFEEMFGTQIMAIKAAEEEHFQSYLCVLPAEILSGLYKEHSTRLLEKNVRSFLQFRGVNKGIRETIRKEPEKFVAYNNGLTITATSAEINIDDGLNKIKSLTDFQIVNGGQTTATIYFTQKDGFDISEVKVMAKINVAKETTDDELEELISNISTFSNAQSRVSKVDLRSRNPQLVKIKSLSESVLTPSGNKWFFERAKGDFNTKLRIAGTNKNRLRKEYPNERRFSKEQLAKYYCAWGARPFMVKKGGEKVFRYFIEEICGEGTSKKALNINRLFFEEMISKILIFRRLEKIYGQGKNSMGQLRSAVVPYSISVLYSYTDGNKKSDPFDLIKVWINEGLNDDLELFFNDLLLLMNDLIKRYSDSDDYGEYSKKEELWVSIIASKEIESFMKSEISRRVLDKYTIPREEYNERQKTMIKSEDVDFGDISESILIHKNGIDYYKELLRLLNGQLLKPDERMIESLIHSIKTRADISDIEVQREKRFIKRLRIDNPAIFDQLSASTNDVVKDTLDLIIKVYNRALETGSDVEGEFDKKSKFFSIKGYKYSSVYQEIGKQLKAGIIPSVKQIYYASHSLKND